MSASIAEPASLPEPGRNPLRIGIVAALPAELAPLVKAWTRQGNVHQGSVRLPNGTSATIYARAAGMGSAAASRAFADVVSAAGTLDAVVSYGWAGALSCGVKPPDVFTVNEVIDSRTGERFATAAPVAAAPLRLVTLDHVARANEKRTLAERYQAVLVDMEAATIARLAQAHGIPFFCSKAISDAYTDVLPDFNRFLDRAGQLRLPAFVGSALLQPRYWAPLYRLGIHSKAAAANLANHWADHLPDHLPLCRQHAALLSCMP